MSAFDTNGFASRIARTQTSGRLVDLLGRSDALVLGEHHLDTVVCMRVVDEMSELKEAGVTTMVLEVPPSAQLSAINQGADLNPRLIRHAFRAMPGSALADVVIAAADNGVTIYPLDSLAHTLAELVHKTQSIETPEAVALNAARNIEMGGGVAALASAGHKVVAIAGRNHVIDTSDVGDGIGRLARQQGVGVVSAIAVGGLVRPSFDDVDLLTRGVAAAGRASESFTYATGHAGNVDSRYLGVDYAIHTPQRGVKIAIAEMAFSASAVPPQDFVGFVSDSDITGTPTEQLVLGRFHSRRREFGSAAEAFLSGAEMGDHDQLLDAARAFASGGGGRQAVEHSTRAAELGVIGGAQMASAYSNVLSNTRIL